MSRLALRGRVVIASVLVLALGVSGIGVGLNVLLTHRLSADADAVLEARADAQRATIDVRRGRAVVRDGARDEALDRAAWVFAGGAAIARPPASAALRRRASELSRGPTPRTRNVPGEVRLLAVPAFASDGRTRIATVVVGVSLAPYEDTERFARVGTVALAAFVLLAGAAVAWRAIGAGLRPVAEMARAAESYSEQDLSRRFGLGPVRDEISGLAATLDGLLDRLQAGLAREQRLSAEIAHELRTPLSGIRAEAELALLDADMPSPGRNALGAIVAGADRMNAAIDALLKAAHDGDANRATCELAEAVRTALDASAPRARERGIGLEVVDALPEVRLGADSGIVVQTLQPLLDNAIRHARSMVSVRAARGASSISVAIEDDGPGIAERDATRIFQPGVQASGGSGAGLGLALSRRLARSIGGEVRTEASQLGARLVVEWPTVARGSAAD